MVAKVSAVGEHPARDGAGDGDGAVDGGAVVHSPGLLDGGGSGAGAGADAVALIRDGKVDLVVNTPRGRGPRADGAYIRRAANQHRVACLTTVAAARAAVAGIADRAANPLEVRSLQEYHAAEQEQLPLS